MLHSVRIRLHEGRDSRCLLWFLCSLPIILCLLLVPCTLASHSPREDQSNHKDAYTVEGSQDLSERYDYTNIYSTSLDEIKVTNLLLSSDIEGNLHALNRHTGELVWSFVGDGPLVSIVSDNKEVRASSPTTTPTEQSASAIPGDGQAAAAFSSSSNGATMHMSQQAPQQSAAPDMTWVIEPYGDGTIYHFTAEGGLQKLPASIKQLVMKSPFSLGDDFIYTGVRKSGIVKINARTGQLLDSYGLDQSNSTLADFTTDDDIMEDDDDDDDDDETIMLGKTVYELQIFSKNDTSWNITYTSWGPNNLHANLARHNHESADNLYIQPFQDSSLLALDASSKSVQWVSSLPYITVNVFDVYYDSDTTIDEKFIVLPHPLNAGYLPEEDESGETAEKYNDATYIERTKEGSWFAMSEEYYPSLVRSAPLAKYMTNERWRVPSILTNPELLSIAITGVHDGSHITGSSDSSELDIYDPLQLPSIVPTSTNDPRRHRTDHYKYDSLYRPSDSMRYYHDRLAIEGPPSEVYTAGTWRKLLYRAFENVIVAFLGIIILLVISKFGVFQSANKLLNSLGFSKEIKLETAPEPIPAPVSVEPTDPVEVPPGKQVHVVEPMDPLTPGSDTETDEPKIVELKDKAKIDEKTEEPKRRRKRGSRGGKKNKKASKKVVVSSANDDDTSSTNSDSLTEINDSLFISKTILGYGSHGTVVFKGSFEDRSVAVKRMLIDFYKIASQEIKLLQESDDHSNVIRYFCSQQSDRFLYIALELCVASLEDVIDRKNETCVEIQSRMDSQNVLWQVANGLNHLHSLKIVHRDIKPQNILIAERKKLQNKDEYMPVRLLISDFGLCKKLDADQSSFRATTAQGAGTSGWRAPELLVEDSPHNYSEHTDTSSASTNRRLTRAIDIFSTGCVFYHFLTNGGHPFGDRYMREGNIIKGKYDLSLLDGTSGEVESKDLISQMIAHEPEDRPDIAAVMKHPYFWSVEKKLDFLLKVSDRYEVERRDPPSALLLKLEDVAPEVIGTEGWIVKFDDEFVENLGKYRKYNGHKLIDLLRAMRNKYHHYQDLPDTLAAKMSPIPDGFFRYFVGKFPNMPMAIYRLVQRELSDDEILGRFY